MKFLKIVGWLLIAIVAVMMSYYLYQDNESLELNEETRRKLTGSFVETPSGVIHYELEGPYEAELVVLVHGFSTPSFLWEPTFRFLRDEGYRVLRFDLYGRGFSDRPDEEYGLALFTKQIQELLSGLNITRPFNLVGLSMGGPIVSRFTHENSQIVKKLILQDPLVHQISPASVSPLDKPVIGEFLAGVMLIPDLIKGNRSSANENQIPGWGEKFEEQSRYKGYRRAILSSLRYLSSHRLVSEYELLAETNMPKLLIWGTEDKTVLFSESETLIKLMPDMQFEPVDGAGHVPSVEKPEIFNQLLLEFLEKESPE